jgi:hypothetical protein
LETEGSEVAPGIVFHYTPEAEVTAIDIDSKASEMVDLSSLEVEGLQVSVATASRQESKAVRTDGEALAAGVCSLPLAVYCPDVPAESGLRPESALTLGGRWCG